MEETFLLSSGKCGAVILAILLMPVTHVLCISSAPESQIPESFEANRCITDKESHEQRVGNALLSERNYHRPTQVIDNESHHLGTPARPCFEGIGTIFEVTSSLYLNITLHSGNLVQVRLESKPRVVSYTIKRIESVETTVISIRGFVPKAEYYLYQDGRFQESFASDDNGVYTYLQDLSRWHHVYILETPSTIYIRSDGSVDPVSAPITRMGSTYAFTSDISEAIVVEADDITVSGAGYTLQGPGSNWGFYLFMRNNVTIVNVTISYWTAGVLMMTCTECMLESIDLLANEDGAVLECGSNLNQVIYNAAFNNTRGFVIELDSNNNYVSNNDARLNDYGFYIEASAGNELTLNLAEDNKREGFYLLDSQFNNVTFCTSNDNDGAGILLNTGGNNSIVSCNITGNRYYGVYLSHSSDNDIIDNWVIDNRQGIVVDFVSNSNFLLDNVAMNQQVDFEVSFDSNANHLSYNTAAHGSGTGFGIRSCSQNVLIENTAYDKTYGFYLDYDATHNTLSNNDAHDNDKVGFLLKNSDYNLLTENSADNNCWDGFRLESSCYNELSENDASNSDYGFYIVSDSDSNLLSSNTAQFAIYGFYILQSSENSLVGNYGKASCSGFTLIGCSSNNLTDNTGAYNSGSGFLLWQASENLLENNEAFRNHFIGVYLESSDSNNLTKNTVHTNDYGVYLNISDQNRCWQNNVSFNDENGIHLNSSSENTFSYNIVETNWWYGFLMWYSNYNCFFQNHITDHVTGVYLIHSNINNFLADTLPHNLWGYDLLHCSNNTFSFCKLSNTHYDAFRLASSSHNVIRGNAILESWSAGIHLSESSMNRILGNNVSNGYWRGIVIAESSNYNVLFGNTIESNPEGIRIEDAQSNQIFHNNIVDNEVQAVDTNPSSNDWHHPVLLEGNYWSNYLGEDDGSGNDKHNIRGDAIGDTMIPWPNTNFDFYPLMYPVLFTPADLDVAVSDELTGIRIEYEEVQCDGVTRVYPVLPEPQPPSGFKVGEQYYEITTTACLPESSTIQIAIPYDESQVTGNEADLKLYHYDSATGWVDVTSSVDTTNNVIYGEVSTLSLFGVFEQVPSDCQTFIIIIGVVSVIVISLVIVYKRRR